LHTLFENYRRRLHCYCRWRVGSDVDAEEIASEVFLRCVNAGCGAFDPAQGALHTWLFRIARNLCVDLYRRRGRISLQDLVVAEEATVPPAAPLCDEPTTEEERLASQVLAPRLLECVSGLTDLQRTLFVNDLDGLSGIESAEMVGSSAGSV